MALLRTLTFLLAGLLLASVPTTLWLERQHDSSATAGGGSTLFFDGVCNLCDGFVQFVADHDPAGRVRFGAIQRHKDRLVYYGAGAYAEGGEHALTTVVLVQNGTVYTRSEAALRAVALLTPPWKYAAGVAYLIPGPLRDVGYKLVAKYRYRVFGESPTCRAPDPRFEQRFIDYDASRSDGGSGGGAGGAGGGDGSGGIGGGGGVGDKGGFAGSREEL